MSWALSFFASAGMWWLYLFGRPATVPRLLLDAHGLRENNACMQPGVGLAIVSAVADSGLGAFYILFNK